MIHKFFTRPRFMDRILLVLISLGFIGIGIGTILGQSPAWPNADVWMICAMVAAGSSMLYAFTLNPKALQLMTALIVTASLMRGYGYAVIGTTGTVNPASRWTGSAVWLIVAVMSIRAHVAERRYPCF